MFVGQGTLVLGSLTCAPRAAKDKSPPANPQLTLQETARNLNQGKAYGIPVDHQVVLWYR